jgi:hypothetical protein
VLKKGENVTVTCVRKQMGRLDAYASISEASLLLLVPNAVTQLLIS